MHDPNQPTYPLTARTFPSWRQWPVKLGAALAAAALALALNSAPAQAATIIADGTTCTLVDAVSAANDDTAIGGCVAGSDADTIELQANVTLVSHVDFNGLPEIYSEITINGNGFTIARDPGAPVFRIIRVSYGILTLNDTTITGGSALGGGILVDEFGSLTVNNSTISGNTGSSANLDGAAITNNGTATVNNSTISNNLAAVGSALFSNGTMTVNNSTVTANNSRVGAVNGSVKLNNSIVANQTAGSDCGTSVSSLGYNLDSDGTCNLTATGDIPNGMADLGPLQVNAPGNTATHALGTNSHAIDAGNCSGGTITVDQRGVARPQGVACDIGAFELEQASNLPPNCAAATASPNTLWPPNHAFKPITINGVSDPDGNPVALSVTSIFQDEAVNAPGSGNTAPDGQGVGSATAQVRTERVGGSDGRVYTIAFTANDGQGGSCTGTVQVGVPHNKKDTPVDGGALFDATVTP